MRVYDSRGIEKVNGGGGNTGTISAGTTQATLGAVVFSNSNGVSFGVNGQTVTAQHNALTNIRVSAGTTSNLLSAITFSDANGISFGLNASTLTASYTVPTVTNSSWTVSDNGTSGTVGRLAFTNLNGVTLSLSSGTGGLHTIVGSHNGLTSQTNQQITLFATGNTTLSSTGTSNASSLIFRGSGVASVGITNGSVLIDVAAGAAAITQSIGMSTQTAGGATAGTTGYATGDDVLYHFVPGSNITMSQSVNGASATLSIYGPAAGGGATISSYENMPGGMWGSSAVTFGVTSLSSAVAFMMPQAGSFSFLRIPVLMTMGSTTIATIASATATAQMGQTSTFNAVVYSVGTGGSSKSLLSVASGSGTVNISGRISISNSTQGSYTLAYSGLAEGGGTTRTTQYSVSNTNYSFTSQAMSEFSSNRFLDIPFANSLSAGAYWLVVGRSTSSSSAGVALSAMTSWGPRYSNHYAGTQHNLLFGVMGSTNQTSIGALIGAGNFSTAGGGTTSAFPISAISSTASNPRMYFQLLRSA